MISGTERRRTGYIELEYISEVEQIADAVDAKLRERKDEQGVGGSAIYGDAGEVSVLLFCSFCLFVLRERRSKVNFETCFPGSL